MFNSIKVGDYFITENWNRYKDLRAVTKVTNKMFWCESRQYRKRDGKLLGGGSNAEVATKEEVGKIRDRLYRRNIEQVFCDQFSGFRSLSTETLIRALEAIGVEISVYTDGDPELEAATQVLKKMEAELAEVLERGGVRGVESNIMREIEEVESGTCGNKERQ